MAKPFLRYLGLLTRALKDGTISYTAAGAITAVSIAITTLTFTTLTGTNITATGVITAATVTATDDVHATDNISAGGALDVTGPLGVTGTVTLAGSASVGTVLTAATGTFTDDVHATDNISAGGALDITGPASVTGATSLTGAVTVGTTLMLTPSTDHVMLPAGTLVVTNTIMRVRGSGGAKTMVSTPTIADGTDGQVIIIQGVNDSNILTLQDESNLGDSGLQLAGGADFALGAGDILHLVYDSGDDNWYEIGRNNN